MTMENTNVPTESNAKRIPTFQQRLRNHFVLTTPRSVQDRSRWKYDGWSNSLVNSSLFHKAQRHAQYILLSINGKQIRPNLILFYHLLHSVSLSSVTM